MKLVIISMIAVFALALALAIAINAPDKAEPELGVAIGNTGKVGVKINDNFCVDPTNGQLVLCI